jgi:hypothetical protein
MVEKEGCFPDRDFPSSLIFLYHLGGGQWDTPVPVKKTRTGLVIPSGMILRPGLFMNMNSYLPGV